MYLKVKNVVFGTEGVQIVFVRLEWNTSPSNPSAMFAIMSQLIHC
jgi:hypothetical protein